MSTSLDDSICAYFVRNTKSETEGDIAIAEQYANALKLMREQLAETQIREIRPSEGFPLIAGGGLTKKDVFVMAHFEGDLFQQLQLTKALILGPPCIIQCIEKCEPIPLGTSPVYTTAMRDLQISATGISSKEKDELKQLIHWMGGHYFQNFGRNITHLISNTIKSNKYEHATLNGVPVMHVDWVQRVWECSQTSKNGSIAATDEEFNKYRLPTFFGANITCSGLDGTRKDAVMRLVNENGGIYHRAFRSHQVDIVITEQSKTDSEKYKAAVRFKKDILLPEWIFDSCERGYALPTKEYEVRPCKQVSTPTKGHANQHVADQTHLSDLSSISFASGPGRRMCSDNTTVNETLSSICSSSSSGGAGKGGGNLAAKQLLKQATANSSSNSGSHKKPYEQALAEICPRKAKQAGSFLDGCCVYLSGFRSAEREKLNRVLNTGGATRYDDPHDGLTHIIVGLLDNAAYRQWQSDGLLAGVQVVQIEWLLESIRAGCIVNELPYRVSLPDADDQPGMASPASKRTLRSMNHSFKQPTVPIKKKLFDAPMPTDVQHEPEPEPDLLTQYSQDQEPAMPLPAASSTQLSMSTAAGGGGAAAAAAAPEPVAATLAAAASAAAAAAGCPDLSASTLSIDFDRLDYLMGASVYVHEACFNNELYDQMITECKAAQGCLVPPSYTDPVDYALVSFEQAFDESELPVQARNVVTELYLESCMKQNKLLPLEYYHRPVPPNAAKEPLRGMTIVVSIYAGLERDYINSLAELLGASLNKAFVKKERPLLICSNPEGSKYEGALKWGYPVVRSDWLVECAQQGEKLPFDRFLVGKSVNEFPISPGLKESRSNNRNTTNKTLTPKNVEMTPQARHDDISTPAADQTTLREENKEQLPVPMEPEPAAQPDMTPLRNRRISELVTGVPGTRRRSSGSSGTPDSPHTPMSLKGTAGGACNFDFLEQVAQRLDTSQARACVRQIIREMRENQTPELERIRRQACTPVNRRQATRPAPGIPDFCLTPEFQQRMADDFERRWRLPKYQISPDTPISVIRQRVMRITCETLGIDYSADDVDGDGNGNGNGNVNPSAGQEPTPARATRKKKQAEQPVGRLLFEADSITPRSPFVPNTQSPSAAAAAAANGNRREDELASSSSTINFDKISFEETTTDNLSDLKQITDYLKNRESRRSSLKWDHEGQTRSEAQCVQPFESEGFALNAREDTVGWRDPAEFNASKRSPEKAGVQLMRHPTTPCFSISCGDDDEKRTQLMERIKGLGGNICQNLVNYDPACTHLLCERPNRGEKLLGCMAAGKWVLNIQYIEDCHARGAFLDETLYEWGSPRALSLPVLAPEEQLIAVAAHRWRSEGGGAFSEQRVILSLQERSLAAIKNVLRAGGATILEVESPFSADPTAAAATHCFVDVKKAPLASHDFAFLHQHGVRIMSQMWINSYLMGGRDANLDKYVLRL